MQKNDIRDLDNQIETQFGDVIVRLQSGQNSVQPAPADFKADLHTQLRDRIEAMQKPSRSVSRLIPLTVGVLVAAIVFGVALWFIDQRPVSAAEIVNRATIAATNSGAFGLKSYSGVRLNWIRNYYCDTCDSQVTPLTLMWQDRMWFQAPNLIRRDFYSYKSSIWNPAYIDDKTVIKDEYGDMVKSGFMLNDGHAMWWFDGKDVFKHSPYVILTSSISPNVANFDALMDSLDKDNGKVTLLGTEIIAGRTAYVLNLIPKPDLTIWPNTAQIKSWIDKETYIQLGQEHLDKHGETLSKWLYINFEPNVPLSLDLFTYKQPEDVRNVFDQRMSLNETELAQVWKVAAKDADFTAFRPIASVIPSKFIAERPYYENVNGDHSITNAPITQTFYLDGEELPALVIGEQKASFGTTKEPIKIGDYDGWYDEYFGRRIILFERDGTHILVQANQRALTKDELIQIAATLQLVPKE